MKMGRIRLKGWCQMKMVVTDENGGIDYFAGKCHFLSIRKGLNLGLKSEKQA